MIKKVFRKSRDLYLLGFFSLILAVNLLFSVFVGVDADADWYSTDWQYRKEITIDSEYVAGNLTDYPLLVSVVNDDLKNMWSDGHVAQIDAGDILFTAADGLTKLSHEIEYYYFSTGELVAWVKLPSVSTSQDTKLYIYYGNENCENQWDTTGDVWSNSYSMVHHFSDDCASENCYLDSVDPISGNHLSPMSQGNYTDLNIDDAKIAAGVNLDGDTEFLKAVDSSALDLSDDFSIEAWVQLTELNRFNGILDKGSFALKIDPSKDYIFEGRIDKSSASYSLAASLGSYYEVKSLAYFDGYLYAAAQGTNSTSSAVYRSNDGSNWSIVMSFSTDDFVGGLQVFKNDLYVFSNNELYQSSNGSSWTSVYTAPENITTTIVFNNYLYIGLSTNGRVYKSLTGDTWSLANDFSDLEIRNVSAMSVFEGQIYVAGLEGKIYKSRDGSSYLLDKDFSSSYKIHSLNVFDKRLWAGINNASALTTYYTEGGGVWVESALP